MTNSEKTNLDLEPANQERTSGLEKTPALPVTGLAARAVAARRMPAASASMRSSWMRIPKGTEESLRNMCPLQALLWRGGRR